MIRQEIWEEMKKAKTYNLSCLHYVNKKRKFNRNYNIFIIGVTAIGGPTFFLSHWFAFVTTIAASLLEIFRGFMPAFCQSEEELVKLDSLATYYGDTLQKLEDLWNCHENPDNPDEKALMKEKAKILKKSSENEVLMNKLLRSLSQKEDDEIRKQADDYLIRKFYE